MKIIPITKFKRKPGIEEITEVTFLDTDSCDFIVEASNNNVNTIKNWFNTIGVEYTDISLVGNDITYYIEDKALKLSSLSSGEAYILYLLACKAENKKICAFSVLEIMGSRLQNIVYEQFKDYSELTIVTFNAIVPRKWEVERG